MTGTISGTVTDGSGANIPDIKVMVYEDSQLKGTAFTAEDGTYSVTSVTTGSYTILAMSDSYSEGIQNNIAVSDGATSTVNFTLTALDMSTLVGQLTSVLNVYNEVEDKQMHNAANLASSTLIALTQYAEDSSQKTSLLNILSTINGIINSFIMQGQPSDADSKVDFGVLKTSYTIVSTAKMIYAGKAVNSTSISQCLASYNKISSPSISDGDSLGECTLVSMIADFNGASSDKSDLNEIFNALGSWLTDENYSKESVYFGKITASANTVISYLNQQ